MIQVSGLSIDISGGVSVVNFDKFDLAAYELFLRVKALPESQTEMDARTGNYKVTFPKRFLADVGVNVEAAAIAPLPVPDWMFDYQRFIVGQAIDSERYAAFCDCGMGKTPMSLEFGRQAIHRTDGRVLVMEPKAIIPQYVAEARRFYGDTLPVEVLETRERLAEWCRDGRGMAICSYHKLVDGQLPEMRNIDGVICDESSILKGGGGVIKWNLIKSARGIRYKLSCTATPAPNEIMEYASQASFLEKLKTDTDILWTFFSRDKRGNWSVKPHAKSAFYKFLSSWSIYLRNPAAYGFRDNLAEIPAPEFIDHRVDPTDEQMAFQRRICRDAGAGLLADRALGVTQRTKLSEAAKGFYYEAKKPVAIPSNKPRRVAELIEEEVSRGVQVIVWTVFDEEAEIISREYAGDIALLDGKLDDDEREDVIADFISGRHRVLMGKASMLAFGLNLQNAGAMIWSGFTDSYEQYYQGVRRIYRYGQTKRTRIHTVYVDELEGPILQNVMAKKASFELDAAEQEWHYAQALKGATA